jgi:hypothetical protein
LSFIKDRARQVTLVGSIARVIFAEMDFSESSLGLLELIGFPLTTWSDLLKALRFETMKLSIVTLYIASQYIEVII